MRDGGGSTEKMSTQAKLNRIMNQSLAVTATVAWLTLLNCYQKSVDALYGERIHPEHAIDTRPCACLRAGCSRGMQVPLIQIALFDPVCSALIYSSAYKF